MHPTSTTMRLPHDTWDRFIIVSGSTEVGPSSDKFNFWSQLVLTAGAWVSPNTLLSEMFSFELIISFHIATMEIYH